MGIYVNPDNKAFQIAVNSKIYVDKTMQIKELNSLIATESRYLCVSRPRRFGKSIAENMIAAYYSVGADSRAMFEPFKIAGDESFERHLNKYNVLKLDLNGLKAEYGRNEGFFDYLYSQVKRDFAETFTDMSFDNDINIANCILTVYRKTQTPFVIIIDEYDVFVREQVTQDIFRQYLAFLISLFKNAELSPAVALAYITGILPIVRDKIQSKLNVFKEYTMLNARSLTEFVGFTSEEVEALCNRFNMDFAECHRWYDGYRLNNFELYNPNAVVNAMTDGEYEGYWSATGSYDALRDYIILDFEGIRQDVISMISGGRVDVDVTSFLNTLTDFRCKDDVFTYLIHLGYLSYDRQAQQCYIPNREVRDEWVKSIKIQPEYKKIMEVINNSKSLLEATINGDADAVADILNRTHTQVTSPLTYNNEGSFQSAICLAYFYANLKYTIIKELPTGKGYADIALIPYKPNIPAIIIELKNNKSPEIALQQIKDKKYDEILQHYRGQMLFVGVNYDQETKEHNCAIESFEY